MAALDTYNWQDSADRLSDALRPHYADAVKLAHRDAGAALGMPSISFDLSNPKVKEVIDGLAKKVRGITDTTRADIQFWVDKGTEEGLSIAQIAEQIRSEAAGISQTRAGLISRTESADAYVSGSILAWNDSGVVSGKEWLVGPNSCVYCIALSGVVVGLNEEFPNGGGDGPPYHPGCTCDCAPVVAD